MNGNGATNGSISSSTTYSAATGLPLSVSDGTRTSTTVYDQNGRVTTQSDGSGVTAQYSYDSFGRVSTTSDGISTSTYTYNGTDALGHVDNRGAVTRKSVSSASVSGVGAVSSAVFKAAYDADGSLVGQVYPNGVAVSTAANPAGQVIELSYVAADGVTAVGDFVRAYNSAGQVALDSGISKSALYDYDNAGRLVSSMQGVDGWCVAHTYVFDNNSNRLSLTSGASVSDSCASAPTSGTTVSRAFDSADRATFAGATGSYVYDNFGRTLTLPKEDTSSAISVATGASIPSNADVSLMYRVDDKVSSMTTGGITRSYQFDQFGRQSSWVDSNAPTVVHTNHYGDSSDSPTWSTDSTGAWSRNITDVSGNVALVVTGTTSGTISAPVFSPTSSTLQISDMHGDFVATMATDSGTNTLSSSCAFDEYGATFQSAGLSTSGQYGWLGAKERSTELTGLMLMGVRVYNSATGRFLQVDAILGGNAGPYLYPTDPILMLDLSGLSGWSDLLAFLDKLIMSLSIYVKADCPECRYPMAITVLITTGIRSFKGDYLNALFTALGGLNDFLSTGNVNGLETVITEDRIIRASLRNKKEISSAEIIKEIGLESLPKSTHAKLKSKVPHSAQVPLNLIRWL